LSGSQLLQGFHISALLFLLLLDFFLSDFLVSTSSFDLSFPSSFLFHLFLTSFLVNSSTILVKLFNVLSFHSCLASCQEGYLLKYASISSGVVSHLSFKCIDNVLFLLLTYSSQETSVQNFIVSVYFSSAILDIHHLLLSDFLSVLLSILSEELFGL
jgi:hypothetical protein